MRLNTTWGGGETLSTAWTPRQAVPSSAGGGERHTDLLLRAVGIHREVAQALKLEPVEGPRHPHRAVHQGILHHLQRVLGEAAHSGWSPGSAPCLHHRCQAQGDGFGSCSPGLPCPSSQQSPSQGPHQLLHPPCSLTGLRSLRNPPGTSAGSSGFLCRKLQSDRAVSAPLATAPGTHSVQLPPVAGGSVDPRVLCPSTATCTLV